MAHKFLKPKKKSLKPVIIMLALVLTGILLFVFGRILKDNNNPIHAGTQQTPAMEALESQMTGEDKIGTELSMGGSEPQSVEAAAMDGIALRMPWEADGAKQPEDYTLVEYEGLSADQRKEFMNYLGADRYAEWLEQAETEAEKAAEIPWKNSGTKQPIDYTWAEYQALNEVQKKAFMEALGPQKLEIWLQEVKGGNSSQSGNNNQNGNSQSTGTNQSGSNSQNSTNSQNGSSQSESSTQTGHIKPKDPQFYPWEKTGAKKAKDYTWEEYDALSLAQQKAFRSHLGADGFKNWLKKAEEAEYPWKKTGAKQAKDYTWAEYMALKDNQKKGFQETLGAAGFQKWQELALSNTPWKASGAKQPKDYSWEDYDKLTEAQQGAFQEHLGDAAMKEWLKTITEIPWNAANAKQPEKYTHAEYKALKAAQQLAFRLYLGTEEFESWLTEAQLPVVTNPWDKAGAKQPKDYTWAEFNALTTAQQMAFQKHLGDKSFENWMSKVQEKPAANPWDVSGAKQPKDYNLSEFNALTTAQQMAFQNHLGAQGFEAWLNKVQEKPVENPNANPWEKAGAKQAQDYTWEDFSALTTAQQMAFQNYLGVQPFEAWLNKVFEKPAVDSAANPWDTAGAKQPADYSWEEFDALTAAQQMAFQNYLGEAGFEAWLNKAQEKPENNPWDSAGAKQPADYSWEDFNALTGAQQMAFQKSLGEAGFDAWLNKVLGQPEDEPTVAPTVEPTTAPTEAPAVELTTAPTEAAAVEPTTEPTVAPIVEANDESATEPAAASMEEPPENPWDAPDTKQPADYTKEEYDALTEEQKLAFQSHLGTDAFEAWRSQQS